MVADLELKREVGFGVSGETVADGEPVAGQSGDAVVVDVGGHDDKDVKDLMTLELKEKASDAVGQSVSQWALRVARDAYPDVEFAGKEALGYARRIQTGAHNVQDGHENEPAEGAHVESLVGADVDDVVDGRYDAAQAEADEHARSNGAELRLAELVPQRDDDAGDAQNGDEYQVGDLGYGLAVEGVVEPGHEGAHGEHGDARVVDPVGQSVKQQP